MNNSVSVPLYYTYRQNNSGGSFYVNDKVSIYVIIQALSARDANHRAEDIGIYFDGCNQGMDCPCCGDRWGDMYNEEDGTVEPEIYGSDPRNHETRWVAEGEVFCYIYHLNGTVTEIRN